MKGLWGKYGIWPSVGVEVEYGSKLMLTRNSRRAAPRAQGLNCAEERPLAVLVTVKTAVRDS